MGQHKICSQINVDFKNEKSKPSVKSFFREENEIDITTQHFIYIYKLKTSFLKAINSLVFRVLVGNSL